MPKIKGPKTGELTAATFDGRSKQRKPLSESKCLVLISITGNEYCTGDYFRVIANSAVKQFAHTTFLIVDSLHRYNLAALPKKNKPTPTVVEYSCHWYYTNESSFLNLVGNNTQPISALKNKSTVDKRIDTLNELSVSQGLKFDIQRWDDWVSKKEKHGQLGLLEREERALKHNSEFLQSIKKDAESYARRRYQNPKQELIELSQDYVEKESLEIMLIGKASGYNFIAYPGDELGSFKAIRNYWQQKAARDQGNENLHDTLAWLHINFLKTEKKLTSALAKNGLFSSQPDFQSMIPMDIKESEIYLTEHLKTIYQLIQTGAPENRQALLKAFALSVLAIQLPSSKVNEVPTDGAQQSPTQSRSRSW